MCFSYKAINIIIITQKTNFNMIFILNSIIEMFEKKG